jgi:hypothetical protein
LLDPRPLGRALFEATLVSLLHALVGHLDDFADLSLARLARVDQLEPLEVAFVLPRETSLLRVSLEVRHLDLVVGQTFLHY